VSGKKLIPAVSKGGNEENDKKKTNKNRSGSFWKIYLIGGDLEFFWHIGSKKKILHIIQK